MKTQKKGLISYFNFRHLFTRYLFIGYGLLFSLLTAGFLTACSNSPSPNSTAANNEQMPVRSDRVQQPETSTTAQNNSEIQAASNSNGKRHWTRSGDPIDTARFDGTIRQAEALYQKNPSDKKAGKDLSEAYFDRGMALTQARQYAAALGDFRKALKFDPENQEARQWVDRIIGIYNQLNMQYPAEGEEPAPITLQESQKSDSKPGAAANSNKANR